MKKLWRKPELLIIARSNPEEIVLTSCKRALAGGAGYQNNDCMYFGTYCYRCDAYNLT